MAYIYLILAFTFNAAANVLLKIAATNGFSFGGFLKGDWTRAHLIALAAAFLFALNLCFYLVALARIPLSVGYPVMVSMTFFITTAFAIYMGEKLTLAHAIGLALILLGLVLVVRATA